MAQQRHQLDPVKISGDIGALLNQQGGDQTAKVPALSEWPIPRPLAAAIAIHCGTCEASREPPGG